MVVVTAPAGRGLREEALGLGGVEDEVLEPLYARQDPVVRRREPHRDAHLLVDDDRQVLEIRERRSAGCCGGWLRLGRGPGELPRRASL